VSRAEGYALVLVIGLLAMAALVALQPLFWSPAPSAAELYATHRGTP